MRFAAFIKEKRRELRRLGRLIFSKCLNRFLGEKENETAQSHSDVDLGVSALAVVGCRASFIFYFHSAYLPVC